MSALAALITVLERSTADRVVLCPGERPHAVTAEGRHDVGTATLSPAVVGALTAEILSAAGRQALGRGVTVMEDVHELPTGDVVVAEARQLGTEIRLELVRRTKRSPCPESTPVHGYVENARAAAATALYLRAGSIPAMRVNGRIRSCGTEPLDARMLAAWQGEIRDSWTVFDERGDRWVRRDDAGTVHCRMFEDTQGSCTTVIFAGPGRDASRPFHLPRAVQDICEAHDGLLIVSAPVHAQVAAITSAAASFTGRQRGGYVITVEPDDAMIGDIPAALVSRRVASATEMATTIDAAVTELPDVLVVIEPQSSNDVDAAVRAAAGERLVIIGVVARDAMDAVTKIALDAEISGAMRGQLAHVFQGASGVRRIRQLGGGYINAYDVLRTTPEVIHAIEHGDVALLRAAHRAGVTRGRDADAELARAVVQRRLSLRAAVGHASDPAYVVGLVRQKRRAAFRVTAAAAVDTAAPRGWTDLTSSLSTHR